LKKIGMDQKKIRMDWKTVGMDREKIHMTRRAIHMTRKTNRAATDMDCAMNHMDRVSGRKKSALLVGFFGASLTSWQKPAGRVSIQAVLVRP
jgi:hypothetical protein